MIRMRRFHKTYAVLYDVRKAHHRLVMVLLLLFFSINGLYSQKSVAKVGGEPEKYSLLPMGRNWSLGIGGGPTLSMGDLTAVNDGNKVLYGTDSLGRKRSVSLVDAAGTGIEYTFDRTWYIC